MYSAAQVFRKSHMEQISKLHARCIGYIYKEDRMVEKNCSINDFSTQKHLRHFNFSTISLACGIQPITSVHLKSDFAQVSRWFQTALVFKRFLKDSLFNSSWHVEMLYW